MSRGPSNAELHAYATRQAREERRMKIRRALVIVLAPVASLGLLLAIVWAVVAVARLAWGSP